MYLESLYMSQYHYPLTRRAIRRERVHTNRERRCTLQIDHVLRTEFRKQAISHNLAELRHRGFVLPEAR